MDKKENKSEKITFKTIIDRMKKKYEKKQKNA